MFDSRDQLSARMEQSTHRTEFRWRLDMSSPQSRQRRPTIRLERSSNSSTVALGMARGTQRSRPQLMQKYRRGVAVLFHQDQLSTRLASNTG